MSNIDFPAAFTLVRKPESMRESQLLLPLDEQPWPMEVTVMPRRLLSSIARLLMRTEGWLEVVS